MTNLIPPEGYRMVKREYLLRVGAVYCFLFTGVFVCLGVGLIPMYVNINAQIDEITLEIARENDVSEAVKIADGEVSAVKNVLAQLAAPEPPLLISTAIDEIQKLTPEGIVFKTFSVDEGKKSTSTIQVQGIASTREKLIHLKTKLEASELFEKVDVPIADLARDVELPFAITILPSK